MLVILTKFPLLFKGVLPKVYFILNLTDVQQIIIGVILLILAVSFLFLRSNFDELLQIHKKAIFSKY